MCGFADKVTADDDAAAGEKDVKKILNGAENGAALRRGAFGVFQGIGKYSADQRPRERRKHCAKDYFFLFGRQFFRLLSQVPAVVFSKFCRAQAFFRAPPRFFLTYFKKDLYSG